MLTDESAGVEAHLQAASDALNAFAQGPAQAAAESVGVAFENAAGRIAAAFVKAAGRGEMSVRQLAKTALEELARIALDRMLPQAMPARGAHTAIASDQGFARAAVGGITVNFHLADGADGASILRHQGQIAAEVARAVSYGRRNL